MSLLSWLGRAWRPFSRSRALARGLFGIDFIDAGSDDRYFDVTTPLLVRAAASGLTAQSRLLDMGTGAFAVIGLGVWRRARCRVVATDIHPLILERARASVALNRAPVRVLHSRFFDDLDEEFDVVTFNPPYVPTGLAQEAAYQRPFDFQSDGGREGTDVIEGFLDAFAARGGGATALLAVNELLISGARVLALVEARPGLVHVRTHRLAPLLPFHVLALRRAAASAPAPA